MQKLFSWIVVGVVAAVPGVGLGPNVQSAAAVQDHVVKVDDWDRDAENWKWVPEELVVTAGDSVTWDMTGAQMPHSAKADDGSWESGYVIEDSKWSRTFDTPGEYRYHCYPHPWKKGVIRVK